MEPPSAQPPSLRRRVSGKLRIAVTVTLAVVALFLLTDTVTSRPALCASCHEMEPQAATWELSAHARVSCVSCHEAPRPWYERPVTVAERGRLLGNDVWRHVAGRLGETADPSAAVRPSPMPDAVCLSCHDPNRRATPGEGIIIDHAQHAERTGSCVACHAQTAHPDQVLGRPLSLMARCLDCHGTAAQPKASAACATCHPPEFDLIPVTHQAAPWTRDHGFSAGEDAPCGLCHQQSYCDGCHGVAMPHPEEWGEEPSEHGATALRDRNVCARCHADEVDACATCHHERFDPGLGTWLDQHALGAVTTGIAECMACHEPTACIRCHRGSDGVGREGVE